ncbi:hypothetical protein BH23VER1_BH23VER1_20930 [soil metagenome]
MQNHATIAGLILLAFFIVAAVAGAVLTMCDLGGCMESRESVRRQRERREG